MELLIPGLILVGFMVWASTRIKRNAAQAFEPELIENGEFSLMKPEGILSKVDPEEGLMLSAYSKDFGKDAAERVRQLTVQIKKFDDAHFEDICERAEADADPLISEQRGIIDQRRCATIVIGRSEGDVEVETTYRIIGGENAVYQLSVTVLPEAKDDFISRIDGLVGSFALK